MTAREHAERAAVQINAVQGVSANEKTMIAAAQADALTAIALALTEGGPAAQTIDRLTSQAWVGSKIMPAELMQGDIFVHRPSGQAWRWSGRELNWMGGSGFDMDPVE